MAEFLRADKWLWAARFYKTRALAAETGLLGKASRRKVLLKPSTALQVGDLLEIPFPDGPGHRRITVKVLLEKRVSAALAQGSYDETASAKSLTDNKEALVQREAAGRRPSKRDRRQLGKIHGFWD